jgi:hypothetical protein
MRSQLQSVTATMLREQMRSQPRFLQSNGLKIALKSGGVRVPRHLWRVDAHRSLPPVPVPEVSVAARRAVLDSQEGGGVRVFRFALASLLASLLLTACTTERAPTGTAQTLHNLAEVSQLRSAFNQDSSHPRVIVLLSPT